MAVILGKVLCQKVLLLALSFPGSLFFRLLGHLLPERSISHLLGNPGTFLFLFLDLSGSLLFLQSFLVSFS